MVDLLTAENDALRERVAFLEDALFSADVVLPLEWGLSPSEKRMFGALLARESITKEHLLTAVHGVRAGDAPGIQIVDVFICHIRRKLKPFGIRIETLRGEGYRLDAETRRALSQGLAPRERAA